jgi:ferritin-like metal-binding protein YciE
MTVTVRELYVDELNDLYDAEQQILRELAVMAARATSADLRELLEGHYRDTQQHISRLAALFSERDERPRPTHCQSMRSLIEEARARGAALDAGDLLDAVLITTARRIEHYEIAAYGCARSYATLLEDHDAVSVLQGSLDEELAADASLTVLADGGKLPLRDTRLAAEARTSALMPGVWVTETSGFAAVPPRSHSDARFPRAVPSPGERREAAAGPPDAAEAYPQNERMVAKGEEE